MNKNRQELFDYVIWARHRNSKGVVIIGVRSHLSEDRYECIAADNPVRFMTLLLTTRNRWQLVEPNTRFVISSLGVDPFMLEWEKRHEG